MSHPQATPAPPDRPPAVAELRQQAHQRLDCLLDFCLAQQPQASFLDFEKALRARLFGLGQVLVQLFLLARHQSLDLDGWLRRGYRLAEAYARRTLKTSFGPVEYGRAYLLPLKGKK